MRHIGKIASTDQRCVVAFMQLPDKPDHALVILTDPLPPRYQQALMSILESNEGQADETLANVLARRIMPDTGKTVLVTLHERGYLQPMPVSNVLMLPRPNMPFPLEQILQGMNRIVPQSDAPRYADAAMQKFNPHTSNQKADAIEQSTRIASNLLIEAEMLEATAEKKRKDAYALAPHLQPAHLQPYQVKEINQGKTDKQSAKKVAAEVVVAKKVRAPAKRKTEKTA
jgi:hypothetical protein